MEINLLDELIETLQYSYKKNGEKPLTNKWLLNILLTIDRKQGSYGVDIGDDPKW